MISGSKSILWPAVTLSLVLNCSHATAEIANSPVALENVTSSDAYYVIAVSPKKAKLIVRRGTKREGRFVSAESDVEVLSTEDGYIVGKMGNDATLVISIVQVVANPATGSGLMGFLTHKMMEDKKRMVDFYPCHQTLSFDVTAGHVLYVANIDFTLNDPESGARKTVGYTLRNDLEGARSYLAEHAPELAARLEQGTIQTVATLDDGC